VNPLIGNNFIDANVLDRTGGPEDAAVDTILEMKWEGVFTLRNSRSGLRPRMQGVDGDVHQVGLGKAG
jgi:hypothetical protein